MISEVRMINGHEYFSAVPLALYTTDPTGRITFYNEAAARMWGRHPAIGEDQWCGSWRLFWPDGRPMHHDECPMAQTLITGHSVLGAEAIAERPDGTRIWFVPHPSVVRDEGGNVIGGINALVDISDRKQEEIELARHAAIVASSEDAIISKTLEGRITSWNEGARRIFGYTPEEMIGEPILRIIPPELHHEEAAILARLQRGQRIEHFETVRVAKDGHHVEISVTVSPVRDKAGRIVGASKIARDVSQRKQHEAQQKLLLNELNHRIKNTLAVVQAIAGQSLRRAPNPRSFVESFGGRIQALARAHNLLVQGEMRGADLRQVVREQVGMGIDEDRIEVTGPSVSLDPQTTVQLGLVLYELATNARKYGALSEHGGRVTVTWEIDFQGVTTLKLEWREQTERRVKAPRKKGFGTDLLEKTLESKGGSTKLHYRDGGLVCEIQLPLPELERQPRLELLQHEEVRDQRPEPPAALPAGPKRILVVEDDAVIAMEVEAELTAAGFYVVGHVSTVEQAKQMISKVSFDIALLDGNLVGESVGTVAATLVQKGIPFAFATGYGGEGLPGGFPGVPVLVKPYAPAEMRKVLANLLRGVPSTIIPFRVGSSS